MSGERIGLIPYFGYVFHYLFNQVGTDTFFLGAAI